MQKQHLGHPARRETPRTDREIGEPGKNPKSTAKNGCTTNPRPTRKKRRVGHRQKKSGSLATRTALGKTIVSQSSVGLAGGLLGFFFGGEAVVADAADFSAGDGDADIAIGGDLLFELFVEAGLEFADFATAETGDVYVVARAVGFVVVAVAAEMKEVELVDEALAFEEIDGAVDGDEVDFGIDGLGAG
jgi:hypothetical protein